MKFFVYAFWIVAIGFAAHGQAAADPNKHIQVIVDDSGFIQDENDPQGATNFRNFVETFLERLGREHRRDRDATTIRIISADHPPKTVWTGSASDFARRGRQDPNVAALYENRPVGCPNLPGALEEASVNRTVVPADTHQLYFITSGVHIQPERCQEVDQEMFKNMLQLIDNDFVLRIGQMAESFDHLSVHFLTSYKRRKWLQVLAQNDFRVPLYSQGAAPNIAE